MNPLRVWAKNFRTYRALDWRPAIGLTTIVGRNTLGDGADSNGAGKSTVLEALYVALFGPDLPWGEYLTAGGEETVCEVGLEFEHASETYRVRRQFDAKGRGKTTLDLDRAGPIVLDGSTEVTEIGIWHPLTMGSQGETQTLLIRIIGLSEPTFVHSVFAPQGHRHFADPSLPPRERKDILNDALGLEVWDRLKALVTTDIRDINTALEAIAQRLGAFEDDLARKPELEAAHNVYVAAASASAFDLAEAEAAEAGALEKHQQARTDMERRKTLMAEHYAALQHNNAVVARVEEAAHITSKIEHERAEIERLAPLVSQVDSLEAESGRLATAEVERNALIERRGALIAQRTALEAMVADLTIQREAAAADARTQRERGASATCPTCEQPLHGEALEKTRANTEREAARLELKADGLSAQIRARVDEINDHRERADAIVIPPEASADAWLDHQGRLLDARAAQEQVHKHEATLAAYLTVTAPTGEEREAAASALLQAEATLAACPTVDEEQVTLLGREAVRATLDVTTARAADREAQAELTTSEERLRNLASLAERAQESVAERERLNTRLDTLKALERSYGRDGIPALRLEVQAIPQIEAEAQRVLQALGMPFRVELATQRENKTGGIRDTLDVVVHEPAGARSYATYSGGERTRLEVALRLGIARLIAQRSGSASSLLALDELPWLDRSGQTALVEVLRGLTEFEKVVLVSHDEVLADSFDQALVVTRDETGSRLEAAA